MEKNLELSILSMLAALQQDDHVVSEDTIAGNLGENKDTIHYICSALAAKGYIYNAEDNFGDSWGITQEGAIAIDTVYTRNFSKEIDSKNLRLGFQLTKKTLGFVGGGGILFIAGMLFLFSSFPNIQVYLYETDDTNVLYDNPWGKQNIRIALEETDDKFNDWSKICFLVKNEGQEIGTIQVPANNMKIHVSTDAICKDCTSDNDVGLLKSQLKYDICKDIQISEAIENVNFEIITQYDAIWHNPPVKHVYSCNFVEKIEHNLKNTRDYAYSCSLEK